MKVPENLHIGKLIREELRKNKKTVIWLAKELGYSRVKLHRILRNHYIYSDDLWRISSIMKHNFFLDIANFLPTYLTEETEN